MNFESLRWDNPEAAWGFVAVVALALGFIWLGWWKRGILRQAGRDSVLPQMAASVSLRRQRVKAVLTVTGAALIVVALMRPKYGQREGAVTNAGIDVAVALDVSKSMLVRDVVPDRLTGAKLELEGLLGQMHGGRVALVPFAGIPFVQCPLTSDFEVIRAYLEELDVTDMPVPGTAVARALKQSIAVLTADDVKDQLSDKGVEVKQFQGSKHRAIVLLTDGEDHEGEVAEIAKEAADKGIRIFSVGVGSAAGNVVPILADDGSEMGYMKAADGKTPLISGLNEALLQEIAETTGGKYFHFAQRSIVSDLYTEIDQLEKREFESRFAKLGEDQFQWPLLAGLLLLLLEWVFLDRRRPPRRGARRSGASLGIAAALLLALPHYARAQSTPGSDESNAPAPRPAGESAGESAAEATSAGSTQAARSSERDADAWYMTTQPDVDRAIERLRAGQATEALQALDAAKAKIPEHYILHFDFGLAYVAAGQWEKAVESLGRALDSARGDQELRIRYAQATAYALWGASLEKDTQSEGAADKALEKWKSAAEIFEQLLVLDPDNEDAKWNLELALLRVDPPCSKRNDDFEPNDQPSEATPLELTEDAQKDRLEAKRPVRLCPDDVDWFGLQVHPGDRLTVEVEMTTEDLEFDDDSAKPMMALIGPDGKTVIEESALPGKFEERTFHSEGAVAIRLTNTTIDEMDVQLIATVRPPCSSKEDDKEDNDGPARASVMPQDEATPLRICPGDDDWFEAILGEGDSLFAFASAEGDYTEGFDLQLTDAQGQVLARSATNQGARVATLLEPGPGRYLIRVTGGDTAEAKYQLTWKVLPPCPEGNDPLEPNDKPSEAKGSEDIARAAAKMPAVAPQAGAPGVAPTGPQQGQEPQVVTALLRICRDDIDFLRIEAKPDDPKVATILFDHEKGDLKLDLMDLEGKEVLQSSDSSAPGRSAEVVAVPKVEEETPFLVRVEGVEGAENFYVLQLRTPPPPSEGDQSQDQNSEDDEQDEQKDQDQQEQSEGEQEQEQQKEPEPRDPIEEAMEQLDRNPENLEAQEALKNSPMRNVDPEKDW